MPTTLRQWQARFVIDTSSTNHQVPLQDICLYGKAADELRQTVSAYLKEKKPIFFSNRGDHFIGNMMYVHSDGKSLYPYSWSKDKQWLPEGWWFHQELSSSNQLSQYVADPQPVQRLNNFDSAVDHFITYALILERGPDYQSRAIVKGDFRLPFLEKVLREAEEHLVNNLIERGWHIIALEYKGELSMSGELTNREAIFVLGHAEAQAAKTTFNRD